MRPILLIVLAIFVIAAAYTAYGVIMFEPQKPAPLVFNEPDPATLQTLFAESDKAPVVPLTPAQEKQTDLAVEEISKAIVTYKQNIEDSSIRLKATMTLLNGLIGSGQLPAFFLNVTETPGAQRSFEMLDFAPKAETTVTEFKKEIACENDSGPAFQVLIGDDSANTLTCDSKSVGRTDRIFLGGPGNDIIFDGVGNRVVDAGSGDDTIELGRGRTILILEEGWGKDTVKVDCTGAEIAQNEIPKGFAIPWTSKYTNFIALSPRIQPGVVKWEGNVLKNTATGDTLTVETNCFTLIEPN